MKKNDEDEDEDEDDRGEGQNYMTSQQRSTTLVQEIPKEAVTINRHGGITLT